MKEREGEEKEERREGKRKGREVTEGGREKDRGMTEVPEAFQYLVPALWETQSYLL